MSKILVVGGAGYIGSVTARVLAMSGFTPVIFDNLESGHHESVQEFEFYCGDLRNYSEIDAVVSKLKPDAVVHFAAYLNVGESVAEPIKYFENNVGGSLNLIKAMVEYGVLKLVFSSTCATYGQPRRLPVREGDVEKPESPYGESKLMVERTLEWCFSAYGLSSIRLRYFNVAGAWLDGTLGEDKDPYMAIVPIAIETALGHRDEFVMNGEDYPTLDGTCIRDYIHVVDLAYAHVDALRKLNNWTGTAFFNVGVGKGYSNREVLEMVRRVSGCDFKILVGPRRPGDAAEIYADNKLVTKELGWKPQFGLEEIVRSAWDWHSHRNI